MTYAIPILCKAQFSAPDKLFLSFSAAPPRDVLDNLRRIGFGFRRVGQEGVWMGNQEWWKYLKPVLRRNQLLINDHAHDVLPVRTKCRERKAMVAKEAQERVDAAPALAEFDWSGFPAWAAENLTIKDKQTGRFVRFTLNSMQARLFNSMWAQWQATGRVRFNILKHRQPGFSTLIQGLAFYLGLHVPGVEAIVTAHRDDSADAVFRRTKLFEQRCPERLATERNNRKEIQWKPPHGSALRVGVAGDEGFGRSDTRHVYHASEEAHYSERGVEAASNVRASVPDAPGTFVWRETTAKGLNHFYDSWNRATVEGYENFFVGFLEDETCRLNVTLDDAQWSKIPFEWKEDEKRLRAVARELGLVETATAQALAWRRRAIGERCHGLPALFLQEFPCVVGTTRISTNLGIIRIGDAQSASNAETGRITNHWTKGVKPVVRVLTESGREIIATPDHRMATPDAFVSAGESRGHTVRLSPPHFADVLYCCQWKPLSSYTGSVLIDEKWARFLGYFMGDGSYPTKGAISIACDRQDQDVVEEVSGIVRDLIGEPHLRFIGVNRGCHEIRIQRAALHDPLLALGAIFRRECRSWARRVCVPEAIFRSPKHIVREFLSCLFESDGFTGYKCNCVSLFSKHESLLRDVQLLLLGFGITSRIRIEKKVSTFGEYIGRVLRLRSVEALRFHDEIGFRSSRKRNRRYDPGKSAVGRRRTPIEMVDKVVLVEAHGEAEVFDIEVADTHVFGGNGILVHNCVAEDSFVSTGSHVFPLSIVDPEWKRTKTEEEQQPISRYVIERADEKESGRLIRDYHGPLHIWREPESGVPYIVSGDVGRGVNVKGEVGDQTTLDFTTFRVFRRWPDDDGRYEEVACWHGRMDPDMAAGQMEWLGRRYNMALLVPEANHYGLILIRFLLAKYLYPRVFRREKIDKATRTPVQQALEAHWMEYGWFTGPGGGVTKAGMIENLHRLVRDRQILIHDPDAWGEMRTFVRAADGSMDAESGKHDDIVMAQAIAACILTLHPETKPIVKPVVKAIEADPETGEVAINFDVLRSQAKAKKAVQRRIEDFT